MGARPIEAASIDHVQCIAFAFHARPDRGTNLRRPRDRGHDPGPRRGGVFTTHGFGRDGAALLKISLVSFGRVVAMDRRIVGRTTAQTEQQAVNKCQREIGCGFRVTAPARTTVSSASGWRVQSGSASIPGTRPPHAGTKLTGNELTWYLTLALWCDVGVHPEFRTRHNAARVAPGHASRRGGWRPSTQVGA